MAGRDGEFLIFNDPAVVAWGSSGPATPRDLVIAGSVLAVGACVGLGMALVSRHRVREREQLEVPAFDAEEFHSFLAEQAVVGQLRAAEPPPVALPPVPAAPTSSGPTWSAPTSSGPRHAAR
jgi:hypothetical protein